MNETAPPHPGLCAACRHARRLTSDRGSVFWLCHAHTWHPGLQKYPELPVLVCPAFHPNSERPSDPGAGAGDEG